MKEGKQTPTPKSGTADPKVAEGCKGLFVPPSTDDKLGDAIVAKLGNATVATRQRDELTRHRS